MVIGWIILVIVILAVIALKVITSGSSTAEMFLGR